MVATDVVVLGFSYRAFLILVLGHCPKGRLCQLACTLMKKTILAAEEAIGKHWIGPLMVRLHAYALLQQWNGSRAVASLPAIKNFWFLVLQQNSFIITTCEAEPSYRESLGARDRYSKPSSNDEEPLDDPPIGLPSYCARVHSWAKACIGKKGLKIKAKKK